MPPVKRRECNVAGTRAQQCGIQAFGKISKAQANVQNLGKRKAIDAGTEGQELWEYARKRTCKSTGEASSQAASVLSEEVPPKPSKKCIADSNSQLEPAPPPLKAEQVKPATPRKKAVLQSGLIETPTKGARSILESFSFNSSPPTTRSSSPPTSRPSSPRTSPSSVRSSSSICEEERELPDELQDLIDLHTSFLSALSLHYAHHGCLTPVDLRLLNTNVSKIWRKRRVQVDDIRRLLGVAHFTQSAQRAPTPGTRAFALTEYGYGKVCLKIEDSVDSPSMHKRPIDEEALSALFTNSLQRQWQEYSKASAPSATVGPFVETLPLLPVKLCDSLSKLKPLLSKGQRRLEDLKAGAIRAQKASSFHSPSPGKDVPVSCPKPTASRSDSLLSRIRAKELVQSALPPPPSAATLAKKSILQRVEEVVPVLELLIAGSAVGKPEPFDALAKLQQQMETQSFTMPTLVQHMQMSFRNPISKVDAMKSVRMLAEVAPEWVGLKEIGKCVGVTVRKRGVVGKEEVGRRVRGMLEALE